MNYKGYMKNFGLGSSVIILIIVLLFFMVPVFGVTDTTTINVSISSSALISVFPSTINFTGTVGTDNASVNFSIKNIGSANVTNTYVYTSTITDEASNPLGTGSAENYASTGFIMIRNSTATNYSHAGRLEWNLTDILAGEVLNLGTGTTNWGHGYYRNATYGDYLWKVENGTAGYCNDTGATMTIINAAENGSTHRDFTGEPTTAGGSVATGTDYGLFSFTAGPLAMHCVAVANNCTKVFIYKYDQRTEFTGCTVDSNFDSTVLTPGEQIEGKIKATIPQGTPTGNAVVGTLTFSAS